MLTTNSSSNIPNSENLAEIFADILAKYLRLKQTQQTQQAQPSTPASKSEKEVAAC